MVRKLAAGGIMVIMAPRKITLIYTYHEGKPEI
jgi:hypothetical protein